MGNLWWKFELWVWLDVCNGDKKLGKVVCYMDYVGGEICVDFSYGCIIVYFNVNVGDIS